MDSNQHHTLDRYGFSIKLNYLKLLLEQLTYTLLPHSRLRNVTPLYVKHFININQPLWRDGIRNWWLPNALPMVSKGVINLSLHCRNRSLNFVAIPKESGFILIKCLKHFKQIFVIRPYDTVIGSGLLSVSFIQNFFMPLCSNRSYQCD